MVYLKINNIVYLKIINIVYLACHDERVRVFKAVDMHTEKKP